MSILSRDSWGPNLWCILHTLAEKTGQKQSVLEDTDEGYAWKGLLSHLQDIMPCALCVQHYTEAVRRLNPVVIVGNRGTARRRLLRSFFWKLHNDVNARNQKEQFPEESLERYTDKAAFQESLAKILGMVKAAVSAGKLQLTASSKVLRGIDHLRILCGI